MAIAINYAPIRQESTRVGKYFLIVSLLYVFGKFEIEL